MQKRAGRWQGTWLCPLLYGLLLCLFGWSVPVVADDATKNHSRQSSQSSPGMPRPANTAELTRQLRQAIANSDIETFDRLTGGDTSHNRIGMDAKGRTALMYAAQTGNLEAVHKLIRLDSKGIWSWSHQTYAGQPCLRRSNKPVLVNEYINLCDKVNEDGNDPTYGYTALMYACANKGNANERVEVVNYLLNAGADPTKHCGYAQFTALQLAQNAGDATIMAAIERKMAERNAERAETRTESERAEGVHNATLWYNRPFWKTVITINSLITFPLYAWLVAWTTRNFKRLDVSRQHAKLRKDVEKKLSKQPDYIASPEKQQYLSRQVWNWLLNEAGDTHQDDKLFTFEEVRNALKAVLNNSQTTRE